MTHQAVTRAMLVFTGSMAAAAVAFGCLANRPVQPVAGAPTGPLPGEAIFQSHCIGCHTFGEGRLTGPDLQGVVERREYGWIMAMVTNPDSMLREDATARQLFAEYMTPMVNMGVTRDEARALYEYLRSRSEETAPGG